MDIESKVAGGTQRHNIFGSGGRRVSHPHGRARRVRLLRIEGAATSSIRTTLCRTSRREPRSMLEHQVLLEAPTTYVSWIGAVDG